MGLGVLKKQRQLKNLLGMCSKYCSSESSPSILHQHVLGSHIVQVHCFCLSVVQESSQEQQKGFIVIGSCDELDNDQLDGMSFPHTFKQLKNTVIESYRNRVSDSMDIGQIHRVFWARALTRKMLCMVGGNVCVRSSVAILAVKLKIQCRKPQ